MFLLFAWLLRGTLIKQLMRYQEIYLTKFEVIPANYSSRTDSIPALNNLLGPSFYDSKLSVSSTDCYIPIPYLFFSLYSMRVLLHVANSKRTLHLYSIMED